MFLTFLINVDFAGFPVPTPYTTAALCQCMGGCCGWCK